MPTELPHAHAMLLAAQAVQEADRIQDAKLAAELADSMFSTLSAKIPSLAAAGRTDTAHCFDLPNSLSANGAGAAERAVRERFAALGYTLHKGKVGSSVGRGVTIVELRVSWADAEPPEQQAEPRVVVVSERQHGDCWIGTEEPCPHGGFLLVNAFTFDPYTREVSRRVDRVSIDPMVIHVVEATPAELVAYMTARAQKPPARERRGSGSC